MRSGGLENSISPAKLKKLLNALLVHALWGLGDQSKASAVGFSGAGTALSLRSAETPKAFRRPQEMHLVLVGGLGS